MRVSSNKARALVLIVLSLNACHKAEEQHHELHRKTVVTTPEAKDVTITEQYVCQIHSRRHIEIRALERGYLQEVPVKEGQTVKQGELLFKILPTLYQARLASEVAEAQLAQIEFDNTTKLYENRVVSDKEVALAQAKLAKAEAEVQLSQAELGFTDIKAPYDGIVDRLHEQQGSLIEEGDMLTSLSDNSTMWVYFNVPEARYLEYKSEVGHQPDDDDDDDDEADDNDDDADEADDDADDDEADDDADESDDDVEEDVDDNKNAVAERHAQVRVEDLAVDLVLANGNKFKEVGSIGAIEGEFNNETGNIAFRADFPNPDGLLRHGQTGNVIIRHTLHDATVIPQRATFEILDKRYVYIVGKDNVVRQHEIEVLHEMDDIFVIEKGVDVGDRIVLEGIQQIRDGDKLEYEFRAPELVLTDLKYQAE